MKASAILLPAALFSLRGSNMKHKNAAFTLVELAIVLTIISLLVGAMFIGQSVIRSSHLQSIERNVQLYIDATKLFQSKYKDLPGDFPTASSFWPSVGNGNGDGFIGNPTGHPDTTQTANTEPLLFWQHLASAGFMTAETFTGSAMAGKLKPGGNIPRTKIDGSGLYMRYALDGPATGIFDANYGHVIIFGMPGADADTPPLTAALPPTDAYELDQKVDDGHPGTGRVMGFTNASAFNPNCSTSADTTAEYNVSVQDFSCSLIFTTGL